MGSRCGSSRRASRGGHPQGRRRPGSGERSSYDLAHLPGRSPALANLDVTALGLGHGPTFDALLSIGAVPVVNENDAGAARAPSDSGSPLPRVRPRRGMALREDRSALHSTASSSEPRNHAEVVERIRGAGPNDPPGAPESGSGGGCRGQFSCWGSLQWSAWGSWGGLGRDRVRICCKGAPRRDRPWMKARNINVSLSVLRLDRGLCNRFGQPVPPRTLRGGRPRV